jgi:hypothetical protein
MTAVRRDLPAGDVTLIFTDIEGSTALLHELGASEYASVLAARLDKAAFTAAWEKGKTLSDAEAVELALACFEEDDDLLQPT